MLQFKIHKTLKISILLFFLVATISLSASFVFAAPNYQINYQGKLTNSAGVTVANGTYSIVFRLYTVSTGGTNIWTETNSVTVTSGLFSVMLGSSTSLSAINFNQTLYLGVNVAADGEMLPRKILGTVPAAFEAKNANTVGGVASTSLLRNDQVGTITASAAGTLLTVTQNGAGDIFNLFGGSKKMFTVLSGGSVGISSSTPSRKLTVGGTAYFGGNITATGTLQMTALTASRGLFLDAQSRATTTALSATLLNSLTDETGTSGGVVFAGSPTLITPNLGTPSTLVGTNITGTAAGFTAGSVTTNANLTGAITSVGNASVLGSFTSANLSGALTDETGTGVSVFNLSPAFGGTPTFNNLTATGTATFATTTQSARLTLSGSVANIALGSNWLSGDGGDEGVAVDSTGNVDVSGNLAVSGTTRITTNGTITAKAGGASTPSYNFTSGTNMGMYREGTDILGFSTANTARMIIGATGNVGIGTSSPSRKLTVAGSSYFGGNITATGTLQMTALTASRALFTDAQSRATTTALSATLLNSLTDETGTGVAVFSTSPILTTPNLGTPSTLVGTNITGTAASLTAGSVTNATLSTALTVNTGTVTLTGNAANTSVLTLGAGASSVSGANTGDQTTITGNAGSATVLQTARTIAGVSFNGSANIAIASTNLSDTASIMLLGSTQTNTGAKTFLNTTFTLQNVANTFNGSFVNTNTANRVYTLKDAAGTLAFTSDITGTNSGTNTGDQTTIVGISGTMVQFDTAVSDGNIVYQSQALGTPLSGTLTNATGLPIATGVSGLGTGVATFLATPTTANFAAAVTGETGTGAVVFNSSPAFGGTPTFTNLTATGTATFATTTQSARLTLSGSVANIALGSNYLSGDGDDEGVFVSSTGNVGIGTSTATARMTIQGLSSANDVFRVASSSGATMLRFTSTGRLNFGNGGIYNGTDGINVFRSSDGTSGTLTAGGVLSSTYNSNTSAGGINLGTLNKSNVAVNYGTQLSNATFSQTSITSGPFTAVRITPVYNQVGSTAANTDLLINRTETALGSGEQLLIDAQVAGVSRFKLDRVGNAYLLGNLGIGSTTPSRRLTVGGSAYFGGNITATGTLQMTALTASRGLFLDSSSRATTTALSATLLNSLTDETGTGVAVFSTSPTLTTPNLGTPSTLVGTNITGTASGFTAGNVTTNANLTGAITSIGNASSLGSFTSANLLGALTDETGTGVSVFNLSPTFGGTATFSSLTATGIATFATTTQSGRLTLSGSVANIALGSNWLSGDGDDEGIYIGSTGNVGIGTTTPLSKLNVWSSTSADGVWVTSSAALGASSGGGMQLTTAAHPTAANQRLGLLFFGSTNGATNYNSAGIAAYSTEAYTSSSNNGSYLTFETKPTASASGRIERMRIDAAGNVGIGTTTPSQKLTVGGNIAASGGFAVNASSTIIGNSVSTDSNSRALYVTGVQSVANTATVFGIDSQPAYSAGAGSTLAALHGIRGVPQNTGGGTVTSLNGVLGQPQNTSSGLVTTMRGVYAIPNNTGTGTTTTMYGVLSQPRASAGYVANQYSLYADCGASGATAVVSNCYGLFIPAPAVTGTVTNAFGVYQNSTAMINYFAGDTGFGTAAPSAQLEVFGVPQLTSALTDAGVTTGMFALNGNSASAGSGGALTFGTNQSRTAGSVGFAAIKGLLTGGAGNTIGDLAFSTRNATGDTALTERLIIKAGGNVGIGTSTPTHMLTVVDSQATEYAARITNTNTTNTADGLLISLGVANASRATTNYFVGFATLNGTVAGKIQGGASAVAYTTTAADLAEYFPVDDSKQMPQKGEIVSLDPDNQNGVIRAEDGSVPFGIVTTNPGFIGNGPICKAKDNNCDSDYAKDNALVSLVGQVPLKVNNENGAIQVGDSVTISSETGVGMKAHFGDRSVGYALESSDSNDSQATIRVYVTNHTALGMNPDPSLLDPSIASENLDGKTILDRMTQLVQGFVDGVLKVTGIKTEYVKTDELCIGETCVTESQLKTLLQNNNQPPPPPPPPEPDPIPDRDPVPPALTPTPEPTSTPEPTPAPETNPRV